MEVYICSDERETRLSLLEAGVLVYYPAACGKIWARSAKILQHV